MGARAQRIGGVMSYVIQQLLGQIYEWNTYFSSSIYILSLKGIVIDIELDISSLKSEGWYVCRVFTRIMHLGTSLGGLYCCYLHVHLHNDFNKVAFSLKHILVFWVAFYLRSISNL